MDGANWLTRDDQIKAQAAMKEAQAAYDTAKCSATRELTVREMLDDKILDADRKLAALKDLKASLPGSYLDSGCSRFAFVTAAFKA